MARYERDSIGEVLDITWSTKDEDKPFTITSNGMDISLSNRQAGELAMFLIKYITEYME